MDEVSKLGRSIRLGLISAGAPEGYDERLRRSFSLGPNITHTADQAASSVLRAIDTQTQNWGVFNVQVGSERLSGGRYLQAVRWLLNSGVDTIVCVCPLQDEEMHVIGANQHARILGIPVIVSDSADHVDKPSWAKDVVMAAADRTLPHNEAVWDVEPERCRVGGAERNNASAAGVVAGVAMSKLERALPITEVLDSLRTWALLPGAQLAI